MLNSVVNTFLKSYTSAYLMCLSSGRGCTVMPSAPNRSMFNAVFITSGLLPPLEFRSVAILLMFTDNFVMCRCVSNNFKNKLLKDFSGKFYI